MPRTWHRFVLVALLLLASTGCGGSPPKIVVPEKIAPPPNPADRLGHREDGPTKGKPQANPASK